MLFEIPAEIALRESHEKDEMRIKPRSTLVVTGLLRLSSLETWAPSGPMATHKQCVFRKGFPPRSELHPYPNQ